ncbi:MAG: ABC-ATPase domain-containing protein [Eubacteriales bacterium]|nr:ABC-ATPase domain-containing protein [Eubacteriales bacterium]
MKSSAELRTLLRSVDHKSYPAYKSLAGMYQFPSFYLSIDHVQGDPFASPSALHAEIPMARTGFPQEYYQRDCSRIALQDFLTRQLSRQFEQYNFKAKGSGKSGLISISRCGQEVLERSACQIRENRLIVRFHVGFPAFGRTINAGELEKILFDFLPRCIDDSLFYARTDKKKVQEAVFLAEDQEAVRQLLAENHLAAFVADGSVLPRKSGVSELPLAGSVPFASPQSLRQTFSLPHRGDISGMAIPQGITLIVGGGYHGKSTLLEAIQSGVYNHIAGDGREFVITDHTAVKLRAEDGRSVRNVDISLFINDLPNKKDTVSFTTEDASGSTSQAAGVIESMEAGSRLFLIDEDTSATNFMVRDDFMQEVISRKKEPITPFIERVGDLYRQAGISTIMVAGSSGAFFYVADHILQMDCYRTLDITDRVKELCKTHSAPRLQAPGFALPREGRTLPKFKRSAAPSRRGSQNPRALDRGGKYEHMKVKASGLESFSLDRETVNVRYLEQLADTEQVNALAYLLRFALEQVQDGQRSVQETAQIIMDTLDRQGWEAFCSSYVPCGLAVPRVQEVFACLNRFRG